MGRGSAPQEQFDWFSRRGCAEIRLLKTGHQFENRSLSRLVSHRSSTCSEASASSGRAGHRLNIAGRSDHRKQFFKATITTPASRSTSSAFQQRNQDRQSHVGFPVSSRSSNKAIGDFHENAKEPLAPKQKPRRFPSNTRKPCGTERSSANFT